jgi:hypothetical protein
MKKSIIINLVACLFAVQAVFPSKACALGSGETFVLRPEALRQVSQRLRGIWQELGSHIQRGFQIIEEVVHPAEPEVRILEGVRIDPALIYQGTESEFWERVVAGLGLVPYWPYWNNPQLNLEMLQRQYAYEDMIFLLEWLYWLSSDELTTLLVRNQGNFAALLYTSSQFHDSEIFRLLMELLKKLQPRSLHDMLAMSTFYYAPNGQVIPCSLLALVLKGLLSHLDSREGLDNFLALFGLLLRIPFDQRAELLAPPSIRRGRIPGDLAPHQFNHPHSPLMIAIQEIDLNLGMDDLRRQRLIAATWLYLYLLAGQRRPLARIRQESSRIGVHQPVLLDFLGEQLGFRFLVNGVFGLNWDFSQCPQCKDLINDVHAHVHPKEHDNRRKK